MMGHPLLQVWFKDPSFHTHNLTFGHVETLTACSHLAHPMIQTPVLVIHFPHIPPFQPRICLQNYQ